MARAKRHIHIHNIIRPKIDKMRLPTKCKFGNNSKYNYFRKRSVWSVSFYLSFYGDAHTVGQGRPRTRPHFAGGQCDRSFGFGDLWTHTQL